MNNAQCIRPVTNPKPQRALSSEKDTGLAGCVQTQHQNPNLLVAEYLGQELAHVVIGGGR